MTRRTLPALAAAVLLALAACGSDDDSSTTLPAPADSVDQPAEEPIDDDTGDDDSADEAPTGDGVPIGSGNVGGPVVDPQPYPIDSIDILESFPEQLMVNFTGGDPNCTAADATASIDGDVVLVELEVGITEDALTRSCVAGTDVEQSVTIALDEGLDGRDVVAAEPG